MTAGAHQAAEPARAATDIFRFGPVSVEADAEGRKVMRPRESDIEKYLVTRVKALGGEVRKVQWVGRRGAPDRLVMGVRFRWKPNPSSDWFRDRGACWVELKAPGVKPEGYQLREHERMRKMGQRVVVIDSIADVEELLA